MSAIILRILTMMLMSIGLPAYAIDWGKLSNTDIKNALKSSLFEGSDFAVSSLGRHNGFLNNPKAHIPLPASLKKIESTLKIFGMDHQLKELENTLNHAAENAVSTATPILTSAIKKISVQNAKTILTGGDDSVTQYFRHATTDNLTKEFLPIVKAQMDQLNITNQYQEIASKGAKMGLIDKKDADLNQYITSRALYALYAMIAEKEREIRKSPTKAGSEVLQKIFDRIKK